MAESPSPRGSVIPCRVFVGGIAYNTTELELKNFFQSMFGHVKDSKIITDRDGVSKGYGFITFDNQEAADRALETKTLYFEEKKLNIGHAIRKPNSGQFSRPSSPESPLSPISGGQQMSPGVAAATATGYAAAAGSGSMSYTGAQQLGPAGAGGVAADAATAQYYFAPQSAGGGVALDQGVMQPMALGQQGLYAAAQQAIPMACVNGGWYQADARYIVQQQQQPPPAAGPAQKPSQQQQQQAASQAAAAAVQWHHASPQAISAAAAGPAQWGRAAYMPAPAQAMYTPAAAAAAAAAAQASAHGYPVYYQQAEPQWWDPHTGTTVTQQYMPTDVFVDYSHQQPAAMPVQPPQQQPQQQMQLPQQQQQQQQQQPPQQQQQVTYQKAAQPYTQPHGFVAQSQVAPAYALPQYGTGNGAGGEEHETHPYRPTQAGHRGQPNGHLLPRPAGRNGSGRRESGRRGRRSSSFRGLRPPTSSSTLSNSLSDSAFSTSGSSFDHTAGLSGCDSSMSSSLTTNMAVIDSPSPTKPGATAAKVDA